MSHSDKVWRAPRCVLEPRSSPKARALSRLPLSLVPLRCVEMTRLLRERLFGAGASLSLSLSLPYRVSFRKAGAGPGRLRGVRRARVVRLLRGAPGASRLGVWDGDDTPRAALRARGREKRELKDCVLCDMERRLSFVSSFRPTKGDDCGDEWSALASEAPCPPCTSVAVMRALSAKQLAARFYEQGLQLLETAKWSLSGEALAQASIARADGVSISLLQQRDGTS